MAYYPAVGVLVLFGTEFRTRRIAVALTVEKSASPVRILVRFVVCYSIAAILYSKLRLKKSYYVDSDSEVLPCRRRDYAESVSSKRFLQSRTCRQSVHVEGNDKKTLLYSEGSYLAILHESQRFHSSKDSSDDCTVPRGLVHKQYSTFCSGAGRCGNGVDLDRVWSKLKGCTTSKLYGRFFHAR